MLLTALLPFLKSRWGPLLKLKSKKKRKGAYFRHSYLRFTPIFAHKFISRKLIAGVLETGKDIL